MAKQQKTRKEETPIVETPKDEVIETTVVEQVEGTDIVEEPQTKAQEDTVVEETPEIPEETAKIVTDIATEAIKEIVEDNADVKEALEEIATMKTDFDKAKDVTPEAMTEILTGKVATAEKAIEALEQTIAKAETEIKKKTSPTFWGGKYWNGVIDGWND